MVLLCFPSGTVLQPENCERLPNPLNGVVDTSEGREVGSVATYTCIFGFQLVGDTTRVCGDDRMWNGSEPECRGKNPEVKVN